MEEILYHSECIKTCRHRTSIDYSLYQLGAGLLPSTKVPAPLHGFRDGGNSFRWFPTIQWNKNSTKRVLLVLNLFVKTRPCFFSEKGYWMVLTGSYVTIINSPSLNWYFLLNWHPDLMAIVIGSGSWSLTFCFGENMHPCDSTCEDACIRSSWKTSCFKNKHRSETVWTETLQYYIHV